MQQVGIVILNYNNTNDVKKCIDSALKYTPTEITKYVIVDNGSKECVKDEIHRFLAKKTNSFQCISEGGANDLKQITYICLPKNIGYARGNNVGIDFLCQFEEITHIMILNSDILFTEDILTPLLSMIDTTPNVGTVSPLLYRPNGNIDYCCARKNCSSICMSLAFSYIFARIYRKMVADSYILLNEPDLLKKPNFEIDLPSGSCMLMDKSVITQIGGFDNNTFLYYEENILFEKFKKLHLKNYIVPSVSCIHVGGSTTNNTKSALFLKRCNYESLIYYLKTYRNISFIILHYIHLSAKIRLSKMRLNQLLKKR